LVAFYSKHNRLSLSLFTVNPVTIVAQPYLASKFVMSPQLVDTHRIGTRRISCITAGKGHSAVLTDDGSLYTWGQGKINEWRSPVQSALGHQIRKDFQDVSLIVPPRYDNCLCAPMTRVSECHAFCGRTMITRCYTLTFMLWKSSLVVLVSRG
jgi:hypothetical protein